MINVCCIYMYIPGLFVFSYKKRRKWHYVSICCNILPNPANKTSILQLISMWPCNKCKYEQYNKWIHHFSIDKNVIWNSEEQNYKLLKQWSKQWSMISVKKESFQPIHMMMKLKLMTFDFEWKSINYIKTNKRKPTWLW